MMRETQAKAQFENNEAKIQLSKHEAKIEEAKQEVQTKLAAKNDALDWLVSNEKARNIRKKALEEQK